MTKIEKERRSYLKKELREYEKETPMTEEERKILHEWVDEGNSVHENGSNACYEGGRPLDFLDVYREEEEIRQTLDSLCGEERERYLCEIRHEPYVPDLLAEIYKLEMKLRAYAQVLEDHGLLSSAEAHYKEICRPVDLFNTENEELPFS